MSRSSQYKLTYTHTHIYKHAAPTIAKQAADPTTSSHTHTHTNTHTHTRNRPQPPSPSKPQTRLHHSGRARSPPQ